MDLEKRDGERDEGDGERARAKKNIKKGFCVASSAVFLAREDRHAVVELFVVPLMMMMLADGMVKCEYNTYAFRYNELE